jgi:transcriptional regulator with PAS, ATPase and Fis domain
MRSATTSDGPDWLVRDPAMVRLHALAAAIARGSINVLIVGETGSGKEILAEAIHRQSPRHDRPFVRLNCAALPEALVESELFGYERGAFTGADRTTPGLLETADGGTLFLDEIGEMPPTIQAKLLRVIEDGYALPVGGRRARRVSVRFVCATNRDPGTGDSGLRPDLFYRVGGALLRVPPLRERRCEIEPLARLFLARSARELGLRPPLVSDEAVDLLLGHSWPGNVRELRNVIECAMLLCGDEDRITAEHLLPRLTPARVEELPREQLLRVVGGSPERGEGLSHHERRRIVEALDVCAGNQTRAAGLLGVSRATLMRRISAHGIRRPRG